MQGWIADAFPVPGTDQTLSEASRVGAGRGIWDSEGITRTQYQPLSLHCPRVIPARLHPQRQKSSLSHHLPPGTQE